MQEAVDRLCHKSMAHYLHTFKDSVRWNGSESLDGKRVIVYCEQGLGDVIQFSRYFPQFRDAFPKTEVLLCCPAELHRLLKPFAHGVIDKKDDVMPPHDFHVLSMSLPFLLFDPATAFPYITVESGEEITEPYNGLKVGIAWEGNPAHTNNGERSIPLRHFRKLAGDGVKLFMIQKTIHRRQLIAGAEDLELYSTQLNDFYDTARFVNEMDVVVTVDTSVLHLAGAMAKPVIALLSTPGDPRWEVRDWYPTVQAFRKPPNGTWDSVMSEARSELDFLKEFGLEE